MNKIVIYLGDYHYDKYDFYVFEVNKTIEELRKAYYESCEKTNVQFHKYEERNENCDYAICEIFDSIPIDTCKILSDNGIDIKQYLIDYSNKEALDFSQKTWGYLTNTYRFVFLLIEFIKLSLPDLKYSEASFKRSELSIIEKFNNDEYFIIGEGLL